MQVIVHFDGAARPNPGRAAAAAIVLSIEGNTLHHVAEFVGEDETNNAAEYRGMLLALRAAQDVGATDVEIRGDSRLVIQQVFGEWSHDPKFEPVHAEIRALIASFARCTGTHVPRERNAAADALCNAVLDGTYQAFVNDDTIETPAAWHAIARRYTFLVTIAMPKTTARAAGAQLRKDLAAAVARVVPIGTVDVVRI